MRQIWKFELRPGRNEIEMPRGAKILSAHTQRDQPCVWAHVDPGERRETRVIFVLATGEPMEGGWGSFVGTVMLEGGALVFHVFNSEGR